MTTKRLRQDERGFTLIELLVVVLIIGILAAIAIPVFVSQQNQAKDAAAKSDLGSAKLAEISYATANNAADRTVELGDLRPRERQIIDLLLVHRRVPAIAQALGISAHTVRNHLKNLYRRAGVHSQQELLLALKQDDN